MENNFNEGFNNDLAPTPARPQFLKIISILSFVSTGLMILIYLLGTLTLVVNEETVGMVMEEALKNNPNIKVDDPVMFFHEIGKVSLMCLFANIATLIGLIMMWNFNKVGFFVYAAAELVTNFIGLDVSATAGEGKSYGSMIFMILIDLIFIIMYAVNLKYMNKNKSINS